MKIGSTEDLENRFRSLQTANAKPLKLRYVAPGDFDAEFDLHDRFKRLRMNDEWYSRRVLRKLRDRKAEKERRRRETEKISALFHAWIESEHPSFPRRLRVAWGLVMKNEEQMRRGLLGR